jgi:integrase/recombinase XerD
VAGGIAVLNDDIDVYLEMRRAAGYQLGMSEKQLRSFARYAASRGDIHVKASRAIEWACDAPSTHQRCRRLDVVRIFARHVRAEDQRHELPPGHVFPRARPPFLPFIFTSAQIRALLAAAAALSPKDSLRPHTYCTLLSLLAISGLRISEALALRFSDVTADGLVIRQTKFRKTRLVPLHASATTAMHQYMMRRGQLAGGCEHVFVSASGQPLKYATVNGVFRKLVCSAGLHPGRGHRGPRIHDLRHTFAVRSLQACPTDRLSVAAHMLALSTYMGHAKLVSTYWYLHATPHLLVDVADACERFIQGSSS